MTRQSASLLPDTISLIGMPGVGKSASGVLLAKLWGMDFIDADLNIQIRESASLQPIVQAQGYEGLRAIEAEVVADVALSRRVIATGGNVIDDGASMSWRRRAACLSAGESRHVAGARALAAPRYCQSGKAGFCRHIC